MVRVELFAIAANSVRAHLSDILRATGGETSPYTLCKMLEAGVRKVSTAAGKLIRAEVRNEAAARRERLISLGASEDIVRGLVRLFELDVVVTKALIAGALVLLVIGAYAGLVWLFGAVASGRESSASLFVLALLLGIAFRPVARFARRLADRIVYGRRATPYEVLTEFSERVGGAYATEDVLGRMAKPDPLLDLAVQLEEIALADDFFVSRRLYPNVDFYTGLIYKAMGFPTKMFTVLFALGRLPGWIAQWREMINDPETKIGRPRQIYTGATERDYVPAAQR